MVAAEAEVVVRVQPLVAEGAQPGERSNLDHLGSPLSFGIE
jgi:hypothetical protein